MIAINMWWFKSVFIKIYDESLWIKGENIWKKGQSCRFLFARYGAKAHFTYVWFRNIECFWQIVFISTKTLSFLVKGHVMFQLFSSMMFRKLSVQETVFRINKKWNTIGSYLQLARPRDPKDRVVKWPKVGFSAILPRQYGLYPFWISTLLSRGLLHFKAWL